MPPDPPAAAEVEVEVVVRLAVAMEVDGAVDGLVVVVLDELPDRAVLGVGRVGLTVLGRIIVVLPVEVEDNAIIPFLTTDDDPPVPLPLPLPRCATESGEEPADGAAVDADTRLVAVDLGGVADRFVCVLLLLLAEYDAVEDAVDVTDDVRSAAGCELGMAEDCDCDCGGGGGGGGGGGVAEDLWVEVAVLALSGRGGGGGGGGTLLGIGRGASR